MKGNLWNFNGLGDSKKVTFLSDLTKELGLDFIALSETGRSAFSDSFLKNICYGKEFLWHVKPPKGRSRGMLVGINLLFVDVGEIEEDEYFVRFKIRNKEDDFKWNLVSVYGAA
jgi:hypothetical protein